MILDLFKNIYIIIYSIMKYKSNFVRSSFLIALISLISIEYIYASSYEEVAKSTVTIVHENAIGSGFFIKDNLLVTNNHVIKNAINGVVFFVTQENKKGAGIIVATDSKNDLAIIKTLEKKYRPLELGDETKLKMGDDISVIGSPRGLTGTLSKGIISAKRGKDFIQITAPISPGSSGSPVFSKDFKVIGISVMIITASQSLNFAIPVTKLKTLIKNNSSALNKEIITKDLYNIGKMYLQGEGVLRDYKKAYTLNKKAADKKYPPAQLALGIQYYGGLGVNKSYKKAFNLFKEAAKSGNSSAQLFLGDMYRKGIGVSKSYKKAFNWLEKAAKNGESTAQLFLGDMYENGEGINKDQKKAFYWYKKSAMQGNRSAQSRLGRNFQFNNSEPTNHIRAIYWYSTF